MYSRTKETNESLVFGHSCKGLQERNNTGHGPIIRSDKILIFLLKCSDLRERRPYMLGQLVDGSLEVSGRVCIQGDSSQAIFIVFSILNNRSDDSIQ